MNKAPTSHLLAPAAGLLAANTASAFRHGRHWRFAVPSRRAYPFQWLWDSCFHAIVLAHVSSERAIDELESLLAWQCPDGSLPHVIFWDCSRVSRVSWHHLESPGRLEYFLPWRRPQTSALIQPPIVAQAVEEIVIYNESGDVAGDFLRRTLPKLERYYESLLATRDPDQDGLISVITQFETGLDFTPVYDELLGVDRTNPLSIGGRPRVVELANKWRRYDLERIFARGRRHAEDVLVNVVLADGLESLARLATRAGDESLARRSHARAARTTAALLERAWDANQGLFFPLGGPEEHRLSGARTVSALTPLLLADLPQEQVERLLAHLTAPQSFWPRFPVPSVALDDPAYLPDSHLDSRLGRFRLIWRGPASNNTTWLLARGLRRHGQEALARELEERMVELVVAGGWNEFYDAGSGRPVGASDFGWATLAAVPA